MTQRSLGLDLSAKRTRKREFLDAMRHVVPWSKLIALIEPHYPRGKTGRLPLPIGAILQIHFMQQWFGLSDPAIEEALDDMPPYREFAGLDDATTRFPNESTILRFLHFFETNGLAVQILTLVKSILSEKGLMLKARSAVDATSIFSPDSRKNGSGIRDPELHQTKKGNQWYFGMKSHIGVDADSGLVHPDIGTAANVHDINSAEALLHGQETDVYAGVGYQGIEKRCQATRVRWHVTMRPGQRQQLDLNDRLDAI
jgi:IS5 family transposase